MRSVILLSTFLGAASLIACGDDGGGAPDAGPPNDGFVAPDMATRANVDKVDVGPADWTCLNTPSTDVVTAVEITLTGQLLDFVDNSAEINAGTVSVFNGIDYDSPLDTDGPTGIDGAYTLTLPAGSGPRFGFKLVADQYEDTFLLNQYFDPNMAAQTLNVQGISTGIASALPALIGLTRTEGTGVLAGAMRDCQDREVSYAVATVSSAAGTPTHLPGAQTYYLDSGTDLPVRHEQLLHTSENGLFAIFELPATATAYVQVWGFVDDADLADGEMTLLAELPAPVVANTVITGSIEPVRN